MEVAFMETTTRSILSKLDSDATGIDGTDSAPTTLSKTGSNSSSSSSSSKNKERIKKKCLQLISRIEDIPVNVIRYIMCYSVCHERVKCTIEMSMRANSLWWWTCFCFLECPRCWLCHSVERIAVRISIHWSTSSFFCCWSFRQQDRLVTIRSLDYLICLLVSAGERERRMHTCIRTHVCSYSLWRVAWYAW